MAGTAEFSAQPGGLLNYREEGRTRFPDGNEFNGFREYLFERTPCGFIVSFAEIPPRLFHTVKIFEADGVLVGKTSHLCIADQYDSQYTFRPDGCFEVEHTVTGPRKNYISRAIYARE